MSFKNTIVIMTSNVGTRQLEEFGTGIGYRDASSTDYSQLSKEVIEKMLKKSFAPEFLNRIDKIVTFNALGKEVLRDIVDIQLGELTERLQGLELEITYSDKARAFLVEKGFDPKLGARPLNRAIAEYVEDMVTQAIIDGEVKSPGAYLVDVEKGKAPSKLQIVSAS